MAGEDKKKLLHDLAKRNFDYVPVDYEVFAEKAGEPEFARKLSDDLFVLEKQGFIKKAPSYDVLIGAFTPASGGTGVFPTPEELSKPISQQPLPNVGIPAAPATPTGLPRFQESPGLPQGEFQITDVAGQAPGDQMRPQMAEVQPEVTGSSGMPQGAGIIPESTGGYAEILGNAIQRGYNRGEIADYIAATGKTPTAEEIRRIAELNRENRMLETSEAMRQFSENPNLASTLQSLPEVALESIASLYRHGIARMATGGAIGAGIGSVVPGAGTLAGFGTGVLSGMTVAGLGVEVSSTIMDSLNEFNVDTGNEEELKKALSNPEIMKHAREKAYSRGIPIAAFDAVSMGLAGNLLGKPAASAVARGLQVLGEAGIQGAFGAGGEAVAQMASGEEFKPYEILAEGLAEIPGSVPEVAVAMVGKKKATGGDTGLDVSRAVVQNPDMKPEVVSELVDIQVGTGEITEAQANEVKQEFQRKAEINSQIPEQIRNTELRVAAIGLIEDRNKLQQQLETVDEAFKPGIQERIKGINEQLQELTVIPSIEETTGYFDNNKPAETNPILRLPEIVDTVIGQIDEGIMISSERLYEVSNAVNNAIRETLANRALSPDERNATLNILSGMLTDIDKANTAGQEFIAGVEAASVQDRVPATMGATLPRGQEPGSSTGKPVTPSIQEARRVREKQAATTVLPSSGEVIVTPAPQETTEVSAVEAGVMPEDAVVQQETPVDLTADFFSDIPATNMKAQEKFIENMYSQMDEKSASIAEDVIRNFDSIVESMKASGDLKVKC